MQLQHRVRESLAWPILTICEHIRARLCVQRSGSFFVVAGDNKIAILNPYLPLTSSFDNKDFLLPQITACSSTSW